MRNATSWSNVTPSSLPAPFRSAPHALATPPRLRIVRARDTVAVTAARPQSDLHQRASALMARYAAGDERAFPALYLLLRPRLARLCGSMVGPVHELDMLQEVFFKLHRARASFVTGGNAIAWAYAVARRVCIDHLRAPIRTLELAMDHDQLDARGPGVSADEPSLRALLNERLGLLSECVRTTYLLVKAEGLSCAETATLLGISVSAVKQRVHRATAELRAELDGAPCRSAANA